jgi:hypothetical protein
VWTFLLLRAPESHSDLVVEPEKVVIQHLIFTDALSIFDETWVASPLDRGR